MPMYIGEFFLLTLSSRSVVPRVMSGAAPMPLRNWPRLKNHRYRVSDAVNSSTHCVSSSPFPPLRLHIWDTHLAHSKTFNGTKGLFSIFFGVCPSLNYLMLFELALS